MLRSGGLRHTRRNKPREEREMFVALVMVAFGCTKTRQGREGHNPSRGFKARPKIGRAVSHKGEKRFSLWEASGRPWEASWNLLEPSSRGFWTACGLDTGFKFGSSLWEASGSLWEASWNPLEASSRGFWTASGFDTGLKFGSSLWEASGSLWEATWNLLAASSRGFWTASGLDTGFKFGLSLWAASGSLWEATLKASGSFRGFLESSGSVF